MKEVFAFFVAIAILVVATLVSGWLLMLGWNWTMPDLFGFREATFKHGCGAAIMAMAIRQPKAGASRCR